MKLSQTKLNRIKIKDLMASIKKAYDTTKLTHLYHLEQLEKLEKLYLKDATEEDVQKVEKMFIERKLDILYFPSQGKKRMRIKGESKIVPIDYGSKND